MKETRKSISFWRRKEVRVQMDRKQAQNNIGKHVIIDDGDQGTYVGVLEEMIAEPRKPWRGKVKIKAILDLPTSPSDFDKIHKANDMIERQGHKLTLTKISSSFQQSLLDAAATRIGHIRKQKKQLERNEAALKHLLEQFNLDTSTIEVSSREQDEENTSNVLSYTFHQECNSYYLMDEHFEKLDLEHSVLQFEWEANGKHHLGHYEKKGQFISTDGSRYTPEEGAIVSINKQQFEPYFIFQKELEPTALETFEKNLQYHHVTHDHLIHCHNSLLVKLLHSQKMTSFKGVNFLTYNSPNGVLLVQHHYERSLQRANNEKIYDRFEFTTETGERSIITYTNEFSI